jgi:hypothetical protein
MPVPLLPACSLVAPALAAARTETVLRMIAVESAISVTLAMSYLHRLFAAYTATAHPIKIDKWSRYSQGGAVDASLQITSSSPVNDKLLPKRRERLLRELHEKCKLPMSII